MTALTPREARTVACDALHDAEHRLRRARRNLSRSLRMAGRALDTDAWTEVRLHIEAAERAATACAQLSAVIDLTPKRGTAA